MPETTAAPQIITYEIDGVVGLYYKDLTDGETLVFAPDTVIFGASMIKTVYVFALLQKAERDEIDLADEIVYTKDMLVEGTGRLQKAEDGTPYTVQELIAYTMRYSDNTAFSMLQKRFGTGFFAEIMTENGLEITRFGSWWRTNAVQYGKFFAVLYTYLTAENRYGEWLAEIMCDSQQTVMLQRALAPERVAHKYGWDVDSYCDGAVVLNEEHPYVLVFMSNLDEGHLKRANTQFIYAVGGLIKQMHDAKYPAETAVATDD